jgi:hypothetical protein
LPNGHDGTSAAAPEANTRFFTNSRRRIFKGHSVGGESAAVKSGSAAEGWDERSYDWRKKVAMCKREVKNRSRIG